MSTRQPAKDDPIDEALGDDSELLARIGELPRHDLAPLEVARLGANARRAFAHAHAQAQPSALRRLGVLYGRVVEPALVAALCVLYLRWALLAAMALQQ